MKYYKSNEDLICYNEKSDKWFKCNKLGDKLINKPHSLVKITKNEFNKLLNEWYKTIEHSWEYNGVKYSKSICFKDDKELFYKLPNHNTYHYDEAKIVYHQGKLYYACDFHYFPKLVLLDFNNPKIWAKRTNVTSCFAVLNEETKEFI
jgi:hypothetical protein